MLSGKQFSYIYFKTFAIIIALPWFFNVLKFSLSVLNKVINELGE